MTIQWRLLGESRCHYALRILKGGFASAWLLPRAYRRYRKSMVNWLRVCLICIWLHVLHMGMELAATLLLASAALAPAAWAVLLLCAAFSLAFLRAWWRFLSMQPNGLRLLLFFLISYPFFGLLISLGSYGYLAYWTGEPFVFRDYAKEWFTVDVIAGCLVTVLWLLYFLAKGKARQWGEVAAYWNGGRGH